MKGDWIEGIRRAAQDVGDDIRSTGDMTNVRRELLRWKERCRVFAVETSLRSY